MYFRIDERNPNAGKQNEIDDAGSRDLAGNVQ